MKTLTEKLQESAASWSAQNSTHSDFAAIGEILERAAEPEGAGFRLHAPKVRALETYWFLRLNQDTPKIADLYERYIPRGQLFGTSRVEAN